MDQFFEMDLTDRKVVVKEGETSNLGAHTFTVFMAPMVHWPEVMVACEQNEKNSVFCRRLWQVWRAGRRERWAEEAARYF